MKNCFLCGNEYYVSIQDGIGYGYDEPDKYESYVGLKNIRREWGKCFNCGMWHQDRNYPIEVLECIYDDGYRSKDFRGETISEAFNRINSLPSNEVENYTRVEWLEHQLKDLGDNRILDIGSGLGIFAYDLEHMGFDVHCIERNKDSIEFIRSLGIDCTIEIPDKEFDVLTLVHVLEHFKDPVQWLNELKDIIKVPKLYVEVPDAVEFEYLPKDHDEFNSCHVWFFTPVTLLKTIELAGFKMKAMETVRTRVRGLSRIFMLAEAV